jgi:hypothetical protein
MYPEIIMLTKQQKIVKQPEEHAYHKRIVTEENETKEAEELYEPYGETPAVSHINQSQKMHNFFLRVGVSPIEKGGRCWHPHHL